MEKEHWEKAKSKTLNYVNELKATVPGYGYDSKAHAIASDEKICAFVIKHLRQGKAKAFKVIDKLFNAEGNTKELERDLRILKDDLDIFSDEIKVRYCKWENLRSQWLEKVVKKDAMLVKLSIRLNEKMDQLVKLSQGDMKFKFLEAKIKEAKEVLDQMVNIFNERDSACNARIVIRT